MTVPRFTLGVLIGLLVVLTGCASIAFGEEDSSSVEEGFVSELELRTRATRTVLHSLSAAIDNFELDVMRYPTEHEGLQALLENPGLKGWYGPYVIEEKDIADAWGTPLKYMSPMGKEYRIISAGPDRAFGTVDDVEIED